MQDQALPTVAESAMRGIACKCPRCGKGKLYAGFLDLRPACEYCGLDYAFIDSGDGPAIFLIMIAGAIVGALIVTVPVMLTALLAVHSNRPEIGYAFAAKEDDCGFNGDGTSAFVGISGLAMKLVGLKSSVAAASSATT